jgi:two-component system chemotaxis sensor kinase CheA
MSSLLQQFVAETREFLQSIGERLLLLEREPTSAECMAELFRLVHTLKGNSGLFDFPEMNRMLHAGEDLMDAVRDGRVAYSATLADRLLDMVDFVGLLTDEVERDGTLSAAYAKDSAALAQALRQLMTQAGSASSGHPAGMGAELSAKLGAGPGAGLGNDGETRRELPKTRELAALSAVPAAQLLLVPEALRLALYRECAEGAKLWWIEYTPESQCFFKGEDPFFLARQIPGVRWQKIDACRPWGALDEMDAYACNLLIRVLSSASGQELNQHFRYVQEQVQLHPLEPLALVLPAGDTAQSLVHSDYLTLALASIDAGDIPQLIRATNTLLELSAPDVWESSVARWLLCLLACTPHGAPQDIPHDTPHGTPQEQQRVRQLLACLTSREVPDWREPGREVPEASVDAAMDATADAAVDVSADPSADIFGEAIRSQRAVLKQSDAHAWLPGRLKSVARTLTACFMAKRISDRLDGMQAALDKALDCHSAVPLLGWLDNVLPELSNTMPSGLSSAPGEAEPKEAEPKEAEPKEADPRQAEPREAEPKYGRRADDSPNGPTTLKVDQVKIDRLMNLIGEIVVAKNSLPYLAGRAENQYGLRDMGREIKAQYAVINRIAEEMQDAIMQVRMLPVAFIFQRFPRLVRDLSNKLGKQVNLVLEGEDTEVDKNIVEALGDPLIHILRNSLDHGFEMPAARTAAGKPAAGRLLIRASQAADRVILEIADDGKGIDPAVIKRKAYQKGLIDEAALQRITDQEAINLVFASGFSTVETVSELSGRGVGMDVVRNAIDKVRGAISLKSTLGHGTTISLSLPLTMAVSNVIIIESHGQIFGVSMDTVVETVRVPRRAIHLLKNRQTTVLRNRIVPLLSLNQLLQIDVAQLGNQEDELAILVIRHEGEHVGIVVDDFRETVDIILKPLAGLLSGLRGYAGSALLGNGSVLMILNPRELL